MNLCSFCCYCDHFLILPGFPLSHRPSHTPLNMSVEISWYCLILDRSPSTVCRVRASVIHWKFKLLLVWGFPPLCPPLRLQAFSLPSNLQIHTCIWGAPGPSCKHFPGTTGRSCLSVPTSPGCSLGWAFAAMPRGPVGSGRANYTLVTSGTWRKCSCGNTQGTSPTKPAKRDMHVPAV